MTSDLEARRRLANPVTALPYDLGSELAVVLRDACELDVPQLFGEYTAWVQTAAFFRHVPPPAVANAVDWMYLHPALYVPTQQIETARRILSLARRVLDEVRTDEKPVINEATIAGASARRFLQCVLDGQQRDAMREMHVAIARGTRIVDVHDRMLVPVLREADRLCVRNEISVVRRHIVTSAVERAATLLFQLAAPDAHRDLSVVAASVGRSIHQIDARMVADAFAFCGWNATYVGGNIPQEMLLEYIVQGSIDVLALSAEMPSDVMPIRRLIAELEEEPLAPVVLVSGAAFDAHPSLWKKIGADGYAKTLLSGVTLATELISCTECN